MHNEIKPPCAVRQAHDADDRFERAWDHYFRLFDESKRRAEFLTSELEQFLRLLEETAKACTAMWESETSAEEILNFISPPTLPGKFDQLARILPIKTRARK